MASSFSLNPPVAHNQNSNRKHILLGCTGSVASIKIPQLVQLLEEYEVKVLPTKHSLHFFEPSELSVPVHTDEEEWQWRQIGDPILHIELRRWADALVIAPLDANTLAKISHGICDNLLTCVVRAWDIDKPLLFAPAMNTYMWNHPITSKQIANLKEYNYIEIPCVEKKLACGDTGLGAMAAVSTIVQKLKHSLDPP